MQARTKLTPRLLAGSGAGGSDSSGRGSMQPDAEQEMFVWIEGAGGSDSSGGNMQPDAEQEMSVWIEGAGGSGSGDISSGSMQPDGQVAEQQVAEQQVATAVEVKKHLCFAKDMADVFGIDTSKIPNFDEGALIEKIVQGAPDVQGKWNVCSVVKAFAPNLYLRRDNVQKALAKTSIADYPSRKEVQVTRNNVSLLNFLYLQY